MLDLTKVRIVLFDFDGTLAVHPKHSYAEDDGRHYMADVLAHRDHWADSKISLTMKRFMALLSDKHITMGLISATDNVLYANSKVEWVAKHYGFTLANYCTGSFDAKIRMMLGLAEHRHILPQQILFVDDLTSNCCKAEEAGIMACSPMEVVCFMENLTETGDSD